MSAPNVELYIPDWFLGFMWANLEDITIPLSIDLM